MQRGGDKPRGRESCQVEAESEDGMSQQALDAVEDGLLPKTERLDCTFHQ